MTTRRAALLVAAAALVVYWPAVHAGFVGDDFMILHRLRGLTGPSGVLRFFRGEFFEDHRPLGFVAHAADWAIAGADARQFHATNILLHTLNALLVTCIGRELSPRSIAGPLAGLIFALHASNHEAVVWISARFDLLATLFSLAAVWWMVRGGTGSLFGPAALFLGALLSKESAVALPIAAAAFAVFVKRSGTLEAARRLAPWILALAVYAALRHMAGGVSAIGGSGRVPKLAAFGLILAAILALADGRWALVRTWLQTHRLQTLGTACWRCARLGRSPGVRGGTGLAADKLAVAGFDLLNLGSPVLDLSSVPFYLRPGTPAYWLGGLAAIGVAIGLAALAWRPWLADDRAWFLGAFLAAGLLPISALTEGARYLYLPSAAFALLVAVPVVELRGRARQTAAAVLASILVASTGQVLAKERDWRWAGRMTADGARLVDASLAPACGDGHVVFLTEPVAVRGVYTHFLYETFELPRGCMPSVFQVLVRIVRADTRVEAVWDGPRRIVLTAPMYAGDFSFSQDLRAFGPPLGAPGPVSIQTPLGELRGEALGTSERLTLDLAADVDPSSIRFFYYSDGSIRPLTK